MTIHQELWRPGRQPQAGKFDLGSLPNQTPTTQKDYAAADFNAFPHLYINH